MGNIANGLPFEVLCIIFEHYTEFDTPRAPLETLLLVCKYWENAALSDANIWSSFNMAINSLEDLRYWNSCVARRLARCPPSVLLDIRIRIAFLTGEAFKVACKTLFGQLAGDSGEVARRWRRFVLNLDFYIFNVLGRCLSFPTPNLEEFRVKAYRIPDQLVFLPDTSSLRIFHLIAFKISRLPNLANTTDLRISVRSSDEPFDEQAMAGATNVVTMKINNCTPFKLIGTYGRLQALELRRRIFEGCLSTFSAPILTSLTMGFKDGQSFLDLVSCKGINLSTIKKLHIRCEQSHVPEDDVAEYLDGVRQLLTATINLEILVLGHVPIVHSILRILDDECRSLYQSHPVRLVIQRPTREWMTELGPGESGKASIGQLTKDVGCVDGCVMGGYSYRPDVDDIF